MKIAMITPEFPPNAGGIGSYVAYLSNALTARGHEIVVLVRSREHAQSMHKGIEVRRLQVKGIAPFNNRWFKGTVESELSDIRPDLVHVHSSSMPVFRTDVPMVVTSHCCIATNTRPFYRPIRDLESLYRNVFFNVYRSVEGRLAQECDVLTVVGKQMQEDYLTHYGAEAVIVSNGVDPDLFKTENGSAREPVVVYAGALKRGKGLLDLMAAIPRINETVPSVRYELFGDGPLKKQMLHIIASEGLGNVNIRGNVAHEELRKSLSKASVAVLPSYHEGLPTFVLEAMSCQVPVVAADAGGTGELVQHDVNGLLFKAGDSKALADGVTRILRSPDLGKKMGEKGRQLVVDRYNWTTVAGKVIAAYEAAFDGRFH